MKLRTLGIVWVTLSLAALGCGGPRHPSSPPKANLTVPELDVSEVADYVKLEEAEVVPDTSGTQGQLKLTLTQLKDFEGKVLVLEAYDAKEGGVNIGRLPMPAAQDGSIKTTIPSIEMWQDSGKGVFRLVETTR